VKRLQQRLEEVSASTASTYGCTAEVDWMLESHPYYPPVVNDPEAAMFLGDVAADILGEDSVVRDVEATMAGEDFAFIARAVPAAFAFLGIRNESAGATHGLHTAQYVMDEGVLKIGAALHAAVATQYLERYGAGVGHVTGRDEL